MTVSRDDLEAKARQLVGTVDETRESAKETALMTGIALVGLVVLAFYMGGRRGKRSKSIVEVYKV